MPVVSKAMHFIAKLKNNRSASYSLKMKIFKSKMGFHNSCCFHPGSQDVLLSWDIIWLCYSVQVIQVTENKQQAHCQEGLEPNKMPQNKATA